MPSTFARIGRSYPRAQQQPVQVPHAPGGRHVHLKITGGLVVLVSVLSVAGWLILR